MASWFRQSVFLIPLVFISAVISDQARAQAPVEYVEAKKQPIINSVDLPTTLSALNNSQLSFAVEGKLLRVGRDSCKIRQREVNFLKIMPIYKFNKRYFY